VKLLNDSIDFEAYFQDNQDEGAHIRPASEFAEGVIDRFYGEGAESTWTPTGFDKMAGKFDLRPGEVTIWAGINKHGKTTFLTNVMLHVMQAGEKVCVASMEMTPVETMSKMTRQAGGTGSPSIGFIRGFHQWTDGKLWIYKHLGKLPAKRALALATYVRKELGIEHLVIDSLMKCSIGPEDYAGQKDFVDGLCAIARDTGLHIHLVVHMRKGENERAAPDKFSIKGTSEITDLVDNIIIIWKNMRKTDNDEKSAEPDTYVRVAGQRHHPWDGSFAFWFDKESQQFLEHERMHPSHIGIELEAAL